MQDDNRLSDARSQPSAPQGALTAKHLATEFNQKTRAIRRILRIHFGTWRQHAWGSDWQFQSEKDKREVRRLIARVLEGRVQR